MADMAIASILIISICELMKSEKSIIQRHPH